MAAADDALAQRRMSPWSQQHDGYDPGRSRLVRAWLGAMHELARPLADAGVPPTALTVAGICTACLATSSAGSHAPAASSAGLVLATAVCDGLDGAVARQRADAGRPGSQHGGVIDHAADRVTDVLFALALGRAGAPRPTATAAALATLGYEGVRSLLRGRGRVDALVTVGERPIRVVAVVIGLMAAPASGAAIVALISTAAVAQVVRHGLDRADAASTAMSPCE